MNNTRTLKLLAPPTCWDYAHSTLAGTSSQCRKMQLRSCMSREYFGSKQHVKHVEPARHMPVLPSARQIACEASSKENIGTTERSAMSKRHLLFLLSAAAALPSVASADELTVPLPKGATPWMALLHLLIAHALC